jgi:hypothetical protein
MIDPSPELPDDTLIESVELPPKVKDTLVTAGLKTVGDIRETPDSEILHGQALGTEPEAIFGALNHCACRTDPGLPDSSGRLDIDDDRGLQVDRVVVGVGKEGCPL